MLLNELFEAIKPGERKAIQLKIDQYQNAINQIEQHQSELDSYGSLPALPGTEKELEDLKQAYQQYIDELREKLKDVRGTDSFEKYMAAIVRHCPTIVAACKSTGKLLYRGTKEDAPAFYGKPFNDRVAKDSSRDVHDAWNYAMDQAGVVAKRDNSIFTTTSRSLASNFGTQVYIVFFKDPINFTWSDSERDLVLSSEMMPRMVDTETVRKVMSAVWQDDNLREEYKKAYRRIRWEGPDYTVEFDPLNYPTDEPYEIFRKYNFLQSFEAFKEISSNLPPELKKYEDFKSWVNPKTVIQNFGLHIDEDLEGAFNKGYEITIRAEYYAIRLDFEKKVRQYLGMGAYSSDGDY